MHGHKATNNTLLIHNNHCTKHQTKHVRQFIKQNEEQNMLPCRNIINKTLDNTQQTTSKESSLNAISEQNTKHEQNAKTERIPHRTKRNACKQNVVAEQHHTEPWREGEKWDSRTKYKTMSQTRHPDELQRISEAYKCPAGNKRKPERNMMPEHVGREAKQNPEQHSAVTLTKHTVQWLCRTNITIIVWARTKPRTKRSVQKHSKTQHRTQHTASEPVM